MQDTLHGAVRLSDWGVIRASGADARSFLHGQLTQDVKGLPPSQAKLAGYCTAKGRLLASFVIWADGPEDVLMACSADLLPAVLTRLSMFVLRAKCRLSDASDSLPLWGIATPGAATTAAWSLQREGSTARIELPAAQTAEGPVAMALQAGAAPQAPELALSSWHWLEARSATPRVMAATQEQFVPQMVNMELVGGVNFQKGCYPGQEVVARSQYRGTLKRRGHVLECDAALAPGVEIFQADDPEQPAGTVMLAGSHQGMHAAFAELKLAAAQAGGLHAGSANGPAVRLAALPYELPLEAA